MTADVPDNLADDVLLPAYITQRSDGILVDVAQLPPDATFEQFVEQVFSSGARFAGLDYATFLNLLYDREALATHASSHKKIHLAANIVRFAPERRALYKRVHILSGGARAEYVFEPVTLEVMVDEPVHGVPGKDGYTPPVEHVRRVREQPTKLDFDEFVADMWVKGLRFGIDAQAVRSAIYEGILSRLDVAFQRDATDGSDAEIQEASAELHRDNAPKVLANGRTDLKKFKNRFPHVDKGARMLKKVHRVPGKPGRKVTGELIEPPEPQDFDLNALAGPGTRVDEGRDGDFIVAAIDGFLTLDMGSNQVSVTEKIENRGGISVKTTGDLSLAVDEFIEFGEVQEGRVVEGKHMTFKSDVYGMISSLNGNICIDSNLSGGSAKSQGGDVTVNGRASCSVLEAWDGKVTAQFAEGCTIVGKVVTIERAVNCDIIAQELHIGIAEGCGMVAKTVHIDSADMRKDQESVVTLVIPDLSVFEHKIVEARKAAASIASLIEAKARALETLNSDAEFAKFSTLAENIKQGKIKLSDAQMDNWRKLENKFAAQLRQLHELDVAKQALLKQRQAADAEVERLCRERLASGDGVSCEISEVRGDSVVQTAKSSQGLALWRNLPAAELKSRLHSLSVAENRLFFADAGNFSWQYSVPEAPPA